MAKNKTETTTATDPTRPTLENLAKAAATRNAEQTMAALVAHAIACQPYLKSLGVVNEKASERAVRGHWNVKIQWHDGTSKAKRITEHYEYMVAAVPGWSDERSADDVLDATVKAGLLERSRANWIGLPGLSERSTPEAPSLSALFG